MSYGIQMGNRVEIGYETVKEADQEIVKRYPDAVFVGWAWFIPSAGEHLLVVTVSYKRET